MKVLRIALACIAAGTLLGAGDVAAQTTPTAGAARLGGLQGTAAASGVHAFYNPEGALPLAAPVDAGVPDTLATITSGPTTYARASAADPGDLLANPNALFSQGGADIGFPPYPYRVEASSGVGEPDGVVEPGPGLRSTVHADGAGSTAESRMPALAAPAVLTAGSMVSTSSTSTDGATVTVHTRAEVQDIDLLGVLHIESVVTDLTATADGQQVTLAGGTVVSGATVADQPVTIDANGVRPEEGPSGPTPAVADLNELLAGAGIRIAVSAPVQQEGDTAGRLASDGLRIELEVSDETYPILVTLRDLVPVIDSPPGAPGLADVLALTEARHLSAIQVGRGAVTISARPPRPPRPAAPSTADGAAAAGGSVAPSTGARPSTGIATPAAPARLGDAAPVAAPVSDEGVGLGFGEGIGAIAFLVVALQPFVGNRLAQRSVAILAQDQATTCQWEGR